MTIFKQADYTTACGTPDEWSELKQVFAGADEVSILDIGGVLETEKPDSVPDSWTYRRLPIRGNTISEQDMDVYRRELFRHGRLIVLSPNATRGQLVSLAARARTQRTLLPEDKLKELKELEAESELQEWLQAYLVRHQSTELGELER